MGRLTNNISGWSCWQVAGNGGLRSLADVRQAFMDAKRSRIPELDGINSETA
jgi:hypothetical protein